MGGFDEIILAEIRVRLDIPADTPITLEFLNGIEYKQAKYSNVQAILKKQDVSAIKSLPSGGNGGISDNLLIYYLKQKDVSDRLVVILDKFDPWSNPSVLDVF